MTILAFFSGLLLGVLAGVLAMAFLVRSANRWEQGEAVYQALKRDLANLG